VTGEEEEGEEMKEKSAMISRLPKIKPLKKK
jgi:hypothetical protein